MKVHLGKFHIHGPKGCSLANILFLGAELQVLRGFKVLAISAAPLGGADLVTLQPYVYSIE